MTNHVSMTYELERVTHNGDGYSVFTVYCEAEYAHALASRDDPGECRLELDSVTCGGEPFALSMEEERRLIDEWMEALQ